MIFRAERSGIRADRFVLEKFPGTSRRKVVQVFEAGLVLVNGRREKKGCMLEAGDLVEVLEAPPDPGALRPSPQPDLPLDVLREDETLVAMAKPAGMPSHPLRRGEMGTLANALVARFPECAACGDDPREAGLAHRLDAGTSGVIVAGRTREAWTALRDAFHQGRAIKEYLALVAAELEGSGGVIDAPIAHDRSRPGMVVVCADPELAVRRKALPARTEWQVEERFRGFTLVRCQAGTGRMHQVRAHLAHLVAPVAGDELYGVRDVSGLVSGHFLHAARLRLPHPRTGRPLTIEAPLPQDRQAALAALSRACPDHEPRR